MGVSAAAGTSDEPTWESENYLFRIETSLWDGENTKCVSVYDTSSVEGAESDDSEFGEFGAEMYSNANGGGVRQLPPPPTDFKSTHKISPVLEDLKAYLEWFSNVYDPGIQLGRNKPDMETKIIEIDQELSRLPPAGVGQVTTAMTSSNSHGESSSELNAFVERLSSAMTSSGLSNNVNLSAAPMDEFILREFTVIRQLLLRRFLIQRNNSDDNLMNLSLDPETENDLFEILEALSEEIGPALGPKDFPVGQWTWACCEVCLEHKWLYQRACCALPVCGDCLRTYFSAKVNEGVVKIECCNSKCKVYVHRDEISACLDGPDKQKFYKFLAAVNSDPTVKTCPRCSHVTVFPKLKSSHLKNTKKHPTRSRLVCSECSLVWCFNCHSPWHPRLTCRQFRKGDRLMKSWANEIHHGQLNAQKCPRCQVYIQRTTGCDHMHCSRCKTDFCYRCGDRLRKLRFFGDHYSKLSVFGCKYRYKADQPFQRKLVRGAVFGSKVLVAPVLGSLGACAGLIALGFGIFVLPVYGGVRLYQKFSTKGESHFY